MPTKEMEEEDERNTSMPQFRRLLKENVCANWKERRANLSTRSVLLIQLER